MPRHYSDFITVPEDYKASMTQEAINETADKWLEFFPHEKYADFLAALLDCVKSGGKSIWLAGDYGTGKSAASLVTQKLFMDDESRVRRWFEARSKGAPRLKGLEEEVFARRREGTLVVYDYNAFGVGPGAELLVRLEKGVVAGLRSRGMSVPKFQGNLEVVVERVRREGARFFETRDKIQSKLTALHAGIKDVEQLVDLLTKKGEDDSSEFHLLEDVQTTLREDNIFLDVNVASFRRWLDAVRKENRLERVIYIFDEFSEFIEENLARLKTFEEVTEAPGVNRFYLVPVTHKNLNAFWSENSASAGKAEERFYTRDLKMPSDVALRLAADAIRVVPGMEKEWRDEKNGLWGSVAPVVAEFQKDAANAGDSANAKDAIAKDSFYNILPIHPMAAFLLKHLAESARSNQRSVFEYLKGSADGREFQDFIRVGGPDFYGKQFLTVDYLWKYFAEREDLSQKREIGEIRTAYERIKDREFPNAGDVDADVRVLKAVLLFCLLSKMNPEAAEKLRPTVRNVELSFQGDGAVGSARDRINAMRERHCFSVVDDYIELYASSAGGDDLRKKIAELEPKFHELISPGVQDALVDYTKSVRSKHSGGRFELRVTDVRRASLSSLQSKTRAKFNSGSTSDRDDGSICLWFVIAKNKEDQLKIPEKIEAVLRQLRGHRILFFTFPEKTFCEKNARLWDDYVENQAKYELENNPSARENFSKSCERIAKALRAELTSANPKIRSYCVGDEKDGKGEEIVSETLSWANFGQFVSEYEERTLPGCVDFLTDSLAAFGVGNLKAWALAGIRREAPSAQYKSLVDGFQKKGIALDGAWRAQNPGHPLTRIWTLLNKKIDNTLKRGQPFSLRKAYIELQCAPFGLKSNALTAFVLGSVLRDLLDADYQWENGQMSGALTAEILAEIIEAVLKDDGHNKMTLEKTICRQSKERRAFIKLVPKAFGFNAEESATVDLTLASLQRRVETISQRVPLWILPELIKKDGAEFANEIAEILSDVCKACSVSSKGNAPEKAAAVERVGTALDENPRLVETIAEYMRGDRFLTAFRQYVDAEAPELARLAESLGDLSQRYCASVLDKMSDSAGVLWKPKDVDDEIARTKAEYQVLQRARSLYEVDGFSPFERVGDVLRKAASGSALPASIWKTARPAIGPFLDALSKSVLSGVELLEATENNLETIKEFFFDAKKSAAIRIVRERLGANDVDDETLFLVLSDDDLRNGGSKLGEGEFVAKVKSKLGELRKKSVEHRLIASWNRLTDGRTPDEWAEDANAPARYLLGSLADPDDAIAVVRNPQNFSADKLSRCAELLENLGEPTSVGECQTAFKQDAIPEKYSGLKIDVPNLLTFMRTRYGAQPNRWPKVPNIDDFINEQYRSSLAPQIVETIQRRSADDVKAKIIKIAKERPEVGLLFWEKR